ncbi:cytochrome P450 4C1-like isoform X1 [Leptidea sinapis]|uniref:cytochrome P450 4C1-like isoform X1 n=1 Tax=Leptidea sinapis TaxID=189913 RepID=UPI0021420208|nr:cytochrome P450 4C1-like isoform X1 [Leptidea sinapis]
MMIAILLSTVFAILSFISWIYLKKDCSTYNISGPTPLPLVGNGHLFLTRATGFLPLLHRLLKTYGDAVRFHFFHQPYVLLCNPKHIEPLMTDPDLTTKGVSYDYLVPWLGDGLLTATGAKWRLHRKFLTPAFHFNILQNFLPVFVKNQKILEDKLQWKHSDGKEFDLFPVIALTALDNVTEAVMGISYNSQQDASSKYVKSIETLAKLVALKMRNPIVAHDAIFNLTHYKKAHDEAINVLHSHTKEVINMRRKELEQQNITSLAGSSETGIKNKHAFLDLLLLSEINGTRIEDEHIREEVDTFMFAGHDTTTAGVVYALFCLSKEQSIQEKIFEEQIAILTDLSKDPSYNDLQQMKYLEMVIKESLRLFPPVPVIGRLTTKDADLGGLKIRKGTALMVDIIHMQRSPDLYDDPLSFRPERFDSSASKTSNNAFSWLAFSAGQRNCIGQRFAMMELKVILSGIVKKFKVLPVDMEPQLCAELILRSENGVKIKLLPRN